MTTAEGRKTEESQGALPMSRETQRFVRSNLSLDGTANRSLAVVSPPLQYLSQGKETDG